MSLKSNSHWVMDTKLSNYSNTSMSMWYLPSVQGDVYLWLSWMFVYILLRSAVICFIWFFWCFCEILYVAYKYVSWRIFFSCINVVYISATRWIIFCPHTSLAFLRKCTPQQLNTKNCLLFWCDLMLHLSNTQFYRSWFIYWIILFISIQL